MHRLHRTATVIAALTVSVLGMIAAAPSAFAMRLVDPQETVTTSTPVYTVTRGGMAGWEIALIAIGAAVVAAALTALFLRVRLHPGLRPAAR
jgi:hypothetical protein